MCDVALWEINEAFAVVPIAACRILDIDPDLVNISGSGCSLGHPIAATGARMVTTLIYDLQRRGGGIGVAAMCAGGGMGGGPGDRGTCRLSQSPGQRRASVAVRCAQSRGSPGTRQVVKRNGAPKVSAGIGR